MSKRISLVSICALITLAAGPALLAAKRDVAGAKPVSGAKKVQPAAVTSRSATSDDDALHPPKANSLSDSARLDTYVKPDGSGYFALSLAPSKSLPAATSNEVVVLFDTSASQVGVFRDRAIAALRAFASECQAVDRLRLFAVDLTAVALTESFVAADSQQWKDAVENLEHRAPLGATDLPMALRSALGCYSANTTAAKTVVYIGDGVSAADVIVPEEFVKLCVEVVGARLPVTSFAVGPRCDGPMLAALANHTGGMLVIDGERIEAREAGAFLGRSIHEQVLWPATTAWPKVFTSIYPEVAPPLRSDRDTVLIGTGKISGTVDIAMTGTSNGQDVEQNWAVKANRSNNDFSYLTVLVDAASKNHGTTMTILGTAGLQETGRIIASDAEGLATLSGQAVSAGNIESAEQLNEEALRRDPNDPNALAVKKQLEKIKAGDPNAAKDLKIERSKNEQAAPPATVVEDPLGAEYNPSLLDDQVQQNTRIASMIRSEVDKQLKDASGRMGADPERVQSDLKLMQEQVLRSQELGPEVRAQLLGRLERAMREAARRSTDKERVDLDRESVRAAAEERLRITQSLDRSQEKVKQLMDRFNSLMSEGHYLLAEESAAAEVQEMAPNNPVSVAAVLGARTTRYTTQALTTRVARQKGVVDTLAQVEFSHVPFPDDQPIVYPDAGVWEELSMRRKKWKDFASADLKDQKGAAARIRKQLDQPTTIEFVDAPLQDVVDYLKDLHDIEIQIDTKALEDASIGADTPVTRNLKGITLKSALRLMLGAMDLTYVIKNEVLMITTPEKAGNELVTKVYPVADLVIPITVMRMGNGTGGMGGGQMGGGMGGMGGGMGGMGGGMGGMGGGMGGMGGGMGGMGGGGGGFFSVADQPEAADTTATADPNTAADAKAADGGAFAVPDDLKLGPAKNKATDTKTATPKAVTGKPATSNSATGNSATGKSAPNASAEPAANGRPKAPARKALVIDLKLKKGDDAVAAWDKYFAQHEEVPLEDVRATARQLHSERKFDQVAGLIEGALTHGQVQPWMYEALALSLKANHSSNEEVERALMSAVDFSESVDDMMYAAQYMARFGLEERAINVFRQAGAQDPTRPEPFLHGLQLAQRLNDLEGIQWASLGILSQAWPRDKSEIEKSAWLAAQAVYAQLVDEKRTKEAVDFKVKLDKALIRDCKVVVTWTGDADVDVFVKEPSGTICSFRNRRTTAGGMMLGDVASADAPAAPGSSSETYVCPQAFSGTYKLLLRRVWGKVTAGKVTVDVYTHFGTKQVRHFHTQIPLGDQDSIATFDLLDGRRQESLGEQQVANAAIGQVALNQAILNQQINTASSTAAGNNLIVSRAGNFGAFPVIQQAVGYQPVIITLPAGANFAATGVISADRRYVRITSLPVFSQIGMVTTFNISSGMVGTSPTPPPGGGGVSGGTNGFPPPPSTTPPATGT